MANIIDILIKAKDQTKGAFKTATDGMKELNDATEKSAESSKSFGTNWAETMTGISQALMVFDRVVDAAEKVYAVAREGAELEYLQVRFDNLTTSIDTTSRALMTDLREATQGMYSDAELMGSATDFMALGLAKSHDEVVRLSTVAGALNMNMNQLVLTLTNQTTMRFDALGVSVDGFKDKVKELEDAGYNANDAFTEAFLQQAEEQIERVGSATDTALGSFMQFESSAKNLGYTVKKDLNEPVGETVTMMNIWTKELDLELQFKQLKNGLKDAGYSIDDFKDKWKDNQNLMGWIEDEEVAIGVLNEMSDMLYGSAEATETARRAIDPYSDSMEYAGTAAEFLARMEENAAGAASELGADMDEATAATTRFNEEFAKIASLDRNFSGIISYAKKYDDMLIEIGDNEARIAELMGNTTEEGIAERDELIAKNEELKQSMQEMANQVVLDMFQASIAIDGITAAEAEAYFKMAEDMEMISSEAAANAMEVYGNAIEEINNMELLDKDATYTANAELYDPYGIFGWEPKDKTVTYHINTIETKITKTPTATGGIVTRAPGGLTAAAGGYWVGEAGPEPFFPAENGRILSNTEARAAMREGGGRGANIVNVTINTPVNLADRAFVQREITPYIMAALRKERVSDYL